jgi:hypothetical protein
MTDTTIPDSSVLDRLDDAHPAAIHPQGLRVDVDSASRAFGIAGEATSPYWTPCRS